MGNFEVIREDPPLPIYISIPDGEGPFPTVLLFMHRPGMDKPQQIICDDLAKAGYLAIGADSYRDGQLNQETYSDGSIFEDFAITLTYAKTLENVIAERIGIIGFCMGGRHAYLSAARYSELKAVVSYYGFPTRGDDPTNTPIDLVSDMSMPILGIFGGQDPLIPMENVNSFKEVLLNASEENCVEVFEGVQHGFLSPSSPRHVPDAAAQAWMKTLEFYRKYL